MNHVGKYLLIGALLLSPFVRAAEVWHTSTLKEVYPLAEGSFVLIFNANSPSCASLSNPHYFYVTAGQNAMTAEGAKKIYAAALLALATNKRVGIAFDTATPQCFVNRLTVSN